MSLREDLEKWFESQNMVMSEIDAFWLNEMIEFLEKREIEIADKDNKNIIRWGINSWARNSAGDLSNFIVNFKSKQHPDGFIEIIQGAFIISECEPMQRILVKFKCKSDVLTLIKNIHPTEKIRIDPLRSIILFQGDMFKFEKI